jgi:hypothetical protein
MKPRIVYPLFPSLFVTLFLLTVVGCGPQDEDWSSCAAARQHLAACLPGLSAQPQHQLTCGPSEEAEAEHLLALDCGQVLQLASDGKLDSSGVLRGILVKKVGSKTYMKIPLAETFGGDRKQLFDEMVKSFLTGIGQVNKEFTDQGLDLGFLPQEKKEEWAEHYKQVLKQIFDSEVEDDLALELGESYDVEKLSSWRRYIIPQAYIAFFGTKFGANWGVGGGVSATVMFVAQPWLSICIDHGKPEPEIVSKDLEVDLAVMGVPNVDIGGGVGGGVPLRLGVGAVFGPIDRPEDIAGFGLGLSGSYNLPFAGGAMGKVVAVLKKPPLFFVLGGYNTGTGGGGEIHGGAQVLLDLEQFIEVMKGLLSMG